MWVSVSFQVIFRPVGSVSVRVRTPRRTSVNSPPRGLDRVRTQRCGSVRVWTPNRGVARVKSSLIG